MFEFTNDPTKGFLRNLKLRVEAYLRWLLTDWDLVDSAAESDTPTERAETGLTHLKPSGKL